LDLLLHALEGVIDRLGIYLNVEHDQTVYRV
jgi:hypothetical protein